MAGVRFSHVPGIKSAGPGGKPKKHKYRAQKVEVDGVTFASKAEGRRYRDLRLMEQGGVIRDLELQPRFPIEVNGEPVKLRSAGYPGGRRVSYVGDFAYTDVRTGRRRVEDVKGMDTPLSQLKRALVETIYGVEVEIVRS